MALADLGSSGVDADWDKTTTTYVKKVNFNFIYLNNSSK